MASRSSYYDLDAILAEEELIPCTTLFDFSHLAHLDPDARSKTSYLQENSRIKMPLWAVEKWAMLGFVRLSLPRHYGRKARERLEADPGDADLRKKNERFFLAGRMLVDLIETSSKAVAKAIASSPSWRQNAKRTSHTRALEIVNEEAMDLKTVLKKIFGGERLRKSMDWALSVGGDDDLSGFLNKLDEMEKRLFHQGSLAVAQKEQWTMFGNRYVFVTQNKKRVVPRPVSPDPPEASETKRQRVQ